MPEDSTRPLSLGWVIRRMKPEAREEDGQMKAAICQRYGPPEVLQLKEVERPPVKEDEVEVQIHATAVTSSDCIVRSGKVSPASWIPMRLAMGFTGPRRRILGMMFAGEVESASDCQTESILSYPNAATVDAARCTRPNMDSNFSSGLVRPVLRTLRKLESVSVPSR